jgi:hypothetical protein
MGWTTGLTLFPGVILSGMMAGNLTGLALEILLRQPKLKAITGQAPGLEHPDRAGRNTS